MSWGILVLKSALDISGLYNTDFQMLGIMKQRPKDNLIAIERKMTGKRV